MATGSVPQQTSLVKPRLSWLASTIISANTILLILVAWAFLHFGSITAAVHSLNGEPLGVDAATKSFGRSEPGQRIKVAFQLTNYGSAPIRVVGSRVDCSCIVLDDRPFQIDPGGTRSFELTMGLPTEPQKVHRTLSLFTNVPRQQQVDLVVDGEVTGQAGAEKEHG